MVTYAITTLLLLFATVKLLVGLLVLVKLVGVETLSKAGRFALVAAAVILLLEFRTDPEIVVPLVA